MRQQVWVFTLPERVEAWQPKLLHWAGLIASGRADDFKEIALLPDFLSDIFCGLLGYTGPVVPADTHTSHISHNSHFTGTAPPPNRRTPSHLPGNGTSRWTARSPTPSWAASRSTRSNSSQSSKARAPAIHWTTRLPVSACPPWTRPNCAFCEDRGLLPAESLKHAFEHRDPYNPRPVWLNFRGLFRAIDEGNAGLNIPAYNGGLFAAGPALDALQVPDEVCAHFKDLGDYDYRPAREVAEGDEDTEVRSVIDVDILGHIFEQSITDLERLRMSLGAGGIGARTRMSNAARILRVSA
jgi:hypothetical protein